MLKFLTETYKDLPEWYRIMSWSFFAIAITVPIFIEKMKKIFKGGETPKPTIVETQTIKESDNSNVIVFQGDTKGANITINSNKNEEKKNENEIKTTMFLVKTCGIFGEINKIRKYEFNTLKFENDINDRKKKLFIKFISIPIDSLEKHLLKLEEIQDMDSIPKEEFNNKILDIMYDHIKDVKEEMKRNFCQEILNIISDSEFNRTINEIMLEEVQGYLSERNHNESNICALLQCTSSMHFKLKLIFSRNYERYTHLNGVLDKIIKMEDENK